MSSLVAAWVRRLWLAAMLALLAACARDAETLPIPRFHVPVGEDGGGLTFREADPTLFGAPVEGGDALRVVGAASLGPDGRRFNAPIRVTYDLAEALEPGRAVYAGFFDPSRGQWRLHRDASGDVLAGRVEPGGRHATVYVPHFSTGAVITARDPHSITPLPLDVAHGVEFVYPAGLTRGGIWEGVLPGGLQWVGISPAGLGNTSRRQEVYETLFDAILQYQQKPYFAQGFCESRMPEALEGITTMGDLVGSLAEAGSDSSRLLRIMRAFWGTVAFAGPGFNRTALAAVQRNVRALARALDDAGDVAKAVRVTRDSLCVMIRALSTEGITAAREEEVGFLLRDAGLTADPAIGAAFVRAASRLRMTAEAQTARFIDALVRTAQAGTTIALAMLADLGVTVLLSANPLARVAYVVASDVFEGVRHEHRFKVNAAALTTLHMHLIRLNEARGGSDLAILELLRAVYGTYAGMWRDWLNNGSPSVIASILQLLADAVNGGPAAARMQQINWWAGEQRWADGEATRLSALRGGAPDWSAWSSCGAEGSTCCDWSPPCRFDLACRSGTCRRPEAPYGLWAGAGVTPAGGVCSPYSRRSCSFGSCGGRAVQHCDESGHWGPCGCVVVETIDAGADAAADVPPRATDASVPCGGPHRMVCGAVCVDTWSDPAHCGRCGSRCASTQRCELGACVASDRCAGLSCPTCQLCRSGRCEAVADLTACGAGRECVAGACVAACATNYCQAARYDTGAWCDGRAVVRCATSGRCRVETARVACPTDCVAGACTPCPANLADCDGVGANGCEADLRVSAAHCGSCGVACSGGRPCRGGVCDGSAARLALGVGHTCALTTLGTAQCWGDNVDGALGNGAVFPRRDELTPVGVLDLADATDLAAGRFFSCAVRSGGAAVCWGNNGSGQLGTGASGAPMSHFGDVAALRNARQVSAGWGHACAATTADSAVCWGLNLDGRLGDGTTTARPAPVAVAGLTGVARVEAGPTHTCALRREGTVVCWGSGTFGRLGNGSTADQLRPAAMVGITGATGVACARYATCVLRGDGTVACTGGNDNGELGDGGTSGRTVAAPVPGLVDVLRLAAGTTHFCALHRGGSVWCWGRNQEAQLGDGTTADRRVPTRVTGLIDAIEIDAGGDHTCALRPGGRVVCWGANAEGQIGDGTTTARATPTAVVVR